MLVINKNSTANIESHPNSEFSFLNNYLDNDSMSCDLLSDIFKTNEYMINQESLKDSSPSVVTKEQLCPTYTNLSQIKPTFQANPIENRIFINSKPTNQIQQNQTSSVFNQIQTQNNQSTTSKIDSNTNCLKNSSFDFSMSEWMTKNPRQWSTEDVLDWLYTSSLEKEGVDLSRLRGEKFQSINGLQLCNMTVEEFIEKEPEYGSLLFRCFQKIINSRSSTHIRPCLQNEPLLNEQNTVLDSLSSNNSITTGTHKKKCAECNQSLPDIPKTEHQSDAVLSSRQNSRVVLCTNNDSCLLLPASDPYRYPQIIPSTLKPKRRPGRPRTRNLLTKEEIEQEKQKKRMKNQHLWEFLYDALRNPSYNPHLLKWEDEGEGVFRFVQSDRMAHVWGDLKNNENMNYEKLSRAMRHYYRRGILERVEGRRLVYKFSKSAIDKLNSRPKIC